MMRQVIQRLAVKPSSQAVFKQSAKLAPSNQQRYIILQSNRQFQSHTTRSFSSSNQGNQAEVMNLLRGLKNDKGKNIEELNILHSLNVDEATGAVNVKLNLTPDYRKVKQLVSDKLEQIDWVKKVNVSMAPQEQKAQQSVSRYQGLKDVKNIIAVSSCKGGVGKSTVAVNLAFAMNKMGKKIGIFDADLYGPSLPTMINPEEKYLLAEEDDPQKIKPIFFSGVKAMSYGFASTDKGSIMRGPMASNLVTQLVGSTNWGELDYLVVDFPPGTGDIQLTLGQELSLRGAVIVTTPQKLAYVDVVKGIEMFDKLKVPTIAVIENMSYYTCSTCETKHKLFGLGYTNQLKTNFGIKNSFEIPIMDEVSMMSDSGTPFVITLPEHLGIVQIYNQMASQVVQEVENLQKAGSPPQVQYDPKEGYLVIKTDSKVKKIDPYELRIKCKCAACVDEMSGRQVLKPEKVPKDVHPTNILAKGNYATAVVWSDGHRSSIYPYERMLSHEFEDHSK